MATLPPPKVKKAPENSLEKKVYDIVDKFESNILIKNDRYRLSYALVKYMQGAGDPPEICLKSTKVEVTGIALGELAARLNEELGKIS